MMEEKELYPCYGFSQKYLHFLSTKCNTKIFWQEEKCYVIHKDGEVYWLTILKEEKKMTSRESFNEYFEEHTGWDPSDYPNKSYVEDLWDFWQAGRDSND